MAKDILDIVGFTVKKRLGTGARSTIYLATDLENDSEVALKRVIFQKPEDSRVFEQIENEFKVAQQIDHPYVRKCFKLRKKRALLKTKEILLSMEMFDAKTLEEMGNLSLIDVLLVFRMVAMALHAMHQIGYVHCDIKPNNILMNKSGSIKIIDLGQSCRIGTIKQRIQGTPDYIAPEQVKRQPLDQKTDIFNLGATMYWALTGQNIPTMIPQKNSTPLALPKERKAPCEIKKQIPSDISALVMDCVENDPEIRPQNMMAVISRLDVMIHNIMGDKIKTGKNAANNN